MGRPKKESNKRKVEDDDDEIDETPRKKKCITHGDGLSNNEDWKNYEKYYNRQVHKVVSNIFDKNIFPEKYFQITPLFQEFKNNTDKIRLLDISFNFKLYINNIQQLIVDDKRSYL